MYVLNPDIENYINNLYPSDDPILDEMEKLAEELEFPIVGRLTGRLLYQIAMMVKPKKILELGSGFGYSAYWFSKSIGDEGNVVCTEISEDNLKLAQTFIDKTGLNTKIKFYAGNALKLIEKFDCKFDIIFNDIDKQYYLEVIDKAYNKLREGGLLISDNSLWRGRVVYPDDTEATQNIIEYNRLITRDPRFLTTIIPTRTDDGISLSIKL